MATQADMTFVLGETWAMSGQAVDIAGDPIDITGATVTVSIVRNDSSKTDISAAVSDGPNGLWEATVLPTAQVTWTDSEVGDQYTHQITCVMPDTTVHVLNYGKVTVLPSLAV